MKIYEVSRDLKKVFESQIISWGKKIYNIEKGKQTFAYQSDRKEEGRNVSFFTITFLCKLKVLYLITEKNVAAYTERDMMMVYGGGIELRNQLKIGCR